MNKIHLIILAFVILIFLIPCKTESFEPNLIRDEKNDEKFYYNLLKDKIIQTVKDRINTFDAKIVSQIKDTFNISQNKPVDERKEFFVKNVIVMLTQNNQVSKENKVQSEQKKLVDMLNDMSETLDYMYWELKMAPLRKLDQEKLIRLALTSDYLVFAIGLDKGKFFKPDTSRDLIKKTIQTLVSNYTIVENKKVDGTIEEIHDIPLPYDDVTANGKVTKGIKSLV